MNEWISVKDRLPEKSGAYLVYSPEVPVEAGNVWDCSFYEVNGKDLSFATGYNVTHWQPLPAPPESEEG
jgi:hypothetical protein